MLKKRKAMEVSIPTSSMADIAFLLLIFFLVATVIDVDSGIGLTLPEISNLPPPPVSSDRMAAILINENNEVLLDKERIGVSQIKDKLKAKIRTKIELPKNKKLIVSLKTDRKTFYNIFITALDQVKMAFFEVKDEYSNARFGKKFNDLEEEEQELVKEAIPIIISIAEPEQVR
jgi:biopolymer transport protein ExbD